MRVAKVLLSVVATVAGISAVLAASRDQQAPCATPEHRQFDFWVGEWDVYKPDGQLAGTNSIQRILDNCALHEDWHSATSAYAGQSFNVYRPERGEWHQSWIDNASGLLLLDGGPRGDGMILSGHTVGDHGREVLNRITWTPITRDSVRQHWETSKDPGDTWSTVFDGRYVRK